MMSKWNPAPSLETAEEGQHVLRVSGYGRRFTPAAISRPTKTQIHVDLQKFNRAGAKIPREPWSPVSIKAATAEQLTAAEAENTKRRSANRIRMFTEWEKFDLEELRMIEEMIDAKN